MVLAIFLLQFLKHEESGIIFPIIIVLFIWFFSAILYGNYQAKLLYKFRDVLRSIIGNQYFTFDEINIPSYFEEFRSDIYRLFERVLSQQTKNAKRKMEIARIKSVVDAIRKDNINSPEEIVLGEGLGELESDIRAMYERTQSDIHNLMKLEKTRTEFLGNVSHELRTPIFAMQGFLETLINGAIDDPKVNRKFLEKAYHHSHNLNNLLNDLIDISMIESGEMSLVFNQFSAKEFLESIVNEFMPIAEEKGIELKLDPIDEKLKLYGDKSRLKQVLTNLISNACKYTDHGMVEVRVSRVTNGKQILVKDSGLGIEKDKLGRIFERFYRIDKARSRKVGGTGLGLAIVKHILEAHKTKVSVASKPGIGSEFYFVLFDKEFQD